MPHADYLQRFVRNRMVRLGLAFSLIALSVWAFLPYVSYRISSSAFVNAELQRVTAPIAGRLTSDLPHRGNFIERSIAMTLIKALSPDEGHLLHLGAQIAEAKERAALARSQLAEIATADADLAKRAQIYREGMIERLAHERDETEAEKTGCQAEAGQRREVRLQMEELVKAGTASQISQRRSACVAASHLDALPDGRRVSTDSRPNWLRRKKACSWKTAPMTRPIRSSSAIVYSCGGRNSRARCWTRACNPRSSPPQNWRKSEIGSITSAILTSRCRQVMWSGRSPPVRAPAYRKDKLSRPRGLRELICHRAASGP